MKRYIVVASIGLGLITLAVKAQSKTPSPPSQLGHNLIKNGNAEVAGQDADHVPEWGQHGGFSEAEYGSTSGEWDWDLSGCASCGKHYFRLAFGQDTKELSVTQTIDVAAIAGEIDKKPLTASVSGWLGGFHDSDTTGQIIVSFQDAAGKELAKVETKPYDTKQLPKAERGDTGLVLCQSTGQVPSGTRKIVFTWKASATGDSGDHLGLGDNLSLILSES